MKLKLYLFLLAFSCQFISFGQLITDFNGINYIANAGTATVVPGQCYTGALVLTPVVFDIADTGFTTPYTLTNIEANAFSSCGSLTSVDIPN
uniref:hypothetical protein n=1 Tax=Flavobacterium sp. TaxID=239 RepID=UPI00404A5793